MELVLVTLQESLSDGPAKGVLDAAYRGSSLYSYMN